MNANVTQPSAAKKGPGFNGNEQGATKPAGRTFANQAEMDAAVVSELTMPSRLAAILGKETTTPFGVKLAFDQFVHEAGATKDPVERVLIEQMLIAHHRLAKLQVQADAAMVPENVKIYNAAAVRLLGEVRRLALSIRAYRLPAGQKNFAVISQQNIVSSGQQHVQYVDGGKGKESLFARDELNSKPTAEGDIHALRERVAKGEEPASGRRREEKLVAAAGVDA